MMFNPYLMGSTRYMVIAPVVVAKIMGGDEKYIYRNGILPLDTDPGQIQQLLNAGSIREWGTR
ncbi:hypothetical protein [Microbacterium esteraromaticum]|uniref:hypothetical protein n=1 Tax=Microbacterium esteraromaticum TaxID=57043 RepID=UPI001C953B5C|nr:hypothetical protein [Microbacterium esteraromaticum]MBY6061609.1 hypothetical protein [Microbacterium esteraromaticum]